MGEQPVVADGDPADRNRVDGHQQDQVGRPHEVVPEHRNRRQEGDEREDHGADVDVAMGFRHLVSEGYPPEVAVLHPSAHYLRVISCRFHTSGRRASMGGAAAGGGQRAAPRAARPCRRDRCRAEPRGSRLRAPARGAVREGAAERRGGGAGPLHHHGREPSRRPRRGARGLPQPRPRGDARGPQPRRAAGGLPARRPRGVAAPGGRWRGGRPPSAHALRARRGDLRVHRRALRRLDRGLRARAGGHGRGSPAPAPTPGRAAGSGAAGHAGRHRGGRGDRRLAAAAQPGRAGRRRRGQRRAGRPAGPAAGAGGARGARAALHRGAGARRPGAGGSSRRPSAAAGPRSARRSAGRRPA